MKRVLIVDDSPEDIQFVMENLRGHYAVITALSGENALEKARQEPRPDVILMDVMMPEMNGYEACRRLKSLPETHDIEIIFLSAQDTVEEKLAGYDAGGSDYLIKPVQPTELLQKIKLSISNQQTHKQRAEDASTAFDTAMTALSTAGEQGVVINFLRELIVVENIPSLAESIVKSLSDFSLKISVQLRTDKSLLTTGTTTPIPPLEEELLARTQTSNRTMEYGKRSIFSQGGVTLLIKNMPDDGDKRGRLRDHVAILLEAAEEKLRALSADVIIEDIFNSMNKVELVKAEYKKEEQKILSNMMVELENSFHSWELSEAQELKLTNILEAVVDDTMHHFVKTQQFDKEISDNIELLIKNKHHKA